ncbi:hypothetical protein GCM10011581_46210 [Saccharopolyspora subtropica]|uniref:Zinc finger protein n=1 Tax=Saccharopolyspora thermophila TaxID=89367 RepID=A0A917NIL1_9PSEU|nr:zinc finger protein [Saccharopolyspora subtropica]GGJ03956.1 hypothetical protein GCM10011581_46210 [Saccharopolyspora subtropica]
MATYRPHPFHWVPAAGQRHASTDPHSAGNVYATGADVTTLCERRVKAETDELAWLWETCPDCNAAARVLAGLPPMLGAAVAKTGGAR